MSLKNTVFQPTEIQSQRKEKTMVCHHSDFKDKTMGASGGQPKFSEHRLTAEQE